MNEWSATATSDVGSEDGRSTPLSSNSSQRSAPRPISNRTLSDDTVNQKRWSANQSVNGAATKTNFNGQMGKKRKGAGVLGFLTMKEPSTLAFEEFAAAEKEKARQKGSSTTATALGVSSQKLPGFVPKVNSKWDGLPEGARPKTTDSKTKKKDHRNSSYSNASRQSNWTAISSMSGDSQATKRPFGSLTSRPSPTRGSTPSTSLSSSDGRNSSSQSSTRQPPALALLPESEALALHSDSDFEPVEMTDDNKPQTFLRDPSTEPEEQRFLPDPEAWLSPPELEGDDILHLQELDARAMSPITPPAYGSDPMPVLVGIHYPELDSHMLEADVVGAEAASQNDPKQDLVPRQSSRPGSFRRPINFSRPHFRKLGLPALQLPTEQSNQPAAGLNSRVEGVLLSPTLKDSAGRIDPFLTDTFASHSRETGHIPNRVASTLIKDGQRDVSQLREEDMLAESEFSPVSPEEPPAHDEYLSIRPSEPTRSTSSTSVATAVYDPESPPIRSRSEVSLAASLAPSEMSERWQLSPKERLGLGGRMRKSDVLPWEAAEELANTPLSPFSESKRKRLSLRLSSRK